MNGSSCYFKSKCRRKQHCYIKGCAAFGSAECTDDAKTCLMLQRMRDAEPAAVVHATSNLQRIRNQRFSG